MSKTTLEKPLYVRTAPRTKRALDTLIFRLEGMDSLQWRGGAITQEAIINASWMWLAELPDELLEAVFAHYIPRMEAILNGHPDPGGLPSGLPPNVRIGDNPEAEEPLPNPRGHVMKPLSASDPSLTGPNAAEKRAAAREARKKNPPKK